MNYMDNYNTSLLQEYFNKYFTKGAFTYINPVTEFIL